MTKARPQLLNLNGGEIDAAALQRADIEGYANKAAFFENLVATVKGGMRKAPGTRYLGRVTNDAAAIVRPWVYSRAENQHYVMELAEYEIRFMASGAAPGYLQTGAGVGVFDAGGWTDGSSGGGGSSEIDPPWPDGIIDFPGLPP